MRRRRTIPTKPMAILAAIALPLSTAAAGYAVAPGEPAPARALHRLYTPPAGTGPFHQMTRLVRHGDRGAAAALLEMVRTPHAVWFGDDTPEEVEQLVRETTRRAVRRGHVPVLALYNTPGRDCGSYSAGGAQSTAEYRKWIDGVARGIGHRRAMIVLEPDSLALLPSDCGRGVSAGRGEDFADESEGGPDGAQNAEDASEGDAFDSRLFGAGAAGAGVLGGELARAEAQADAQAQKQMARQGAHQAAAPADIDPVKDLPEEEHSDTPDEVHAEPDAPADTPTERPTDIPAENAAEKPIGNAAPEPVSKPGSALTNTPMDTLLGTARKAPALTPTEARARNAARYAELNYAVDRLEPLPGTKVYMDGGHTDWHPVSSIVSRLLHAGVDNATGFALNVSHYQTDEDNAWYGRLISSCLAYVADGGNPAECPDQRWPRLRAERWLEVNVLNEPEEMKHFVTDTSRNGRGPWLPRAGSHADPQSWCNPPGRGLGMRPTTKTGDPLQDAALWVKTPGESDGQCLRGTEGPHDPERGMVDPEAGEWFPEQALELVRNAQPSL